MIVYRSAGEPIDLRSEVRAIRRRMAALPPSAAHDAITAIFIDAAEIEAAAADATFPVVDGLDPGVEMLQAITAETARRLVRSWRGLDPMASVEHPVRDAVLEDGLPRSAVRRVSEGYAYYALYPETYAAAAWRFAAATRPAAAVCVGIRTIGAGLSAILAGALEIDGIPTIRATVRPRGHPFDRRLAVGADLEERLLERRSVSHYLVADEGPGISGSSFASVTTWLEARGVAPDRIQLFPSWVPDSTSLRSDAARAAWTRYPKWHVEAAASKAGMTAVTGGRGIDVSGGRWRRHVYGSEAEWPAAMPRHERVKVLLPDERLIVRFAGLGRYGDARRSRAAALAEAGLGPGPGPLTAGCLTLPFVSGHPCAPRDADAELVARAATHVAFLARRYPARRSPDLEDLQIMVEHNLRELDPSLSPLDLGGCRSLLESAPSMAVDGRMQPHEWIRSGTSLVKVDALDHAFDHFYPGTQDPAWDLAAVEAEFRLGRELSSILIDSYSRLTGDTGARLRLPYYRVAYAACQAGYAAHAAQSLEDDGEVRRFERRRDFFVDRVRALAGARSSQ